MEKIFKNVLLLTSQGDLLKQNVDAIVNPANSFGLMGGGVALAIKQVIGPQIEEDVLRCAPMPLGSAFSTSTRLKLPSKLVLHAVVMEQPSEKTTSKNIDSAVRAALLEANKLGLSSIAFPAVGSGVGGVSISEAASSIVFAVKYYLSNHATSLKKIVFVAFDEPALKHFDRALVQI